MSLIYENNRIKYKKCVYRLNYSFYEKKNHDFISSWSCVAVFHDFICQTLSQGAGLTWIKSNTLLWSAIIIERSGFFLFWPICPWQVTGVSTEAKAGHQTDTWNGNTLSLMMMMKRSQLTQVADLLARSHLGAALHAAWGGVMCLPPPPARVGFWLPRQKASRRSVEEGLDVT